ncbi:hypothetical protein SUGI_1085970 [Cryptomeria japonica]|uniref:probable LRR receptor-like serine/threonine-protein kinase At3g47570 n=1 Tax=Cryptomeria japonica TaxID=3369 RepID=UPI002414B4A5|nr:probable LRR receptor-like serine/threonine-protein kinase At3g47570 [Cryptomeria japonica]GLJ50996.1 hypothetical protein SUGI_1085970 [Cryptomeria japonica]
MPNGSLQTLLYPQHGDCELELERRLDIAIDIGNAMEYLHYNSSVQVVHCNMKPENVLLDDDLTGHVTDFGIARLTSGPESMGSLTSTISIKGSTGYIAPEYGLGGRVTTEGDVYGYGILLLEMLTRKRPTEDIFAGDLNMHKWINSAFPNSLIDVLDRRLLRDIVGMEEGMEEEEDLYKRCYTTLFGIGLACSKDSAEERPNMKVVVRVLESVRDSLTKSSGASVRVWPNISDLVSNHLRGAAKHDRNSSSTSESSSTC